MLVVKLKRGTNQKNAKEYANEVMQKCQGLTSNSLHWGRSQINYDGVIDKLLITISYQGADMVDLTAHELKCGYVPSVFPAPPS